MAEQQTLEEVIAERDAYCISAETARGQLAEANETVKRLEQVDEQRAKALELLEKSQAKLNEQSSIAQAAEADNAGLRGAIALYMQGLDGGKAIIREYRLMQLNAVIEAAQAEKMQIEAA